MGAIGSVLGSALMGVGMSAMGSGKASVSLGTDVNSAMKQSLPSVPEAPTATEVNPSDPSAQSNEQMEAEREKERQKAAWRREQARDVHTSGLGAGGLAETSRKSLLGG